MSGLSAGQYRPGTAPIYLPGAFSKLICLLLLIAAAVCTDTLIGWLALALVTAALIALSGLSFSEAFASVGRLVWFFAVILLMNFLFQDPEGAWGRFWIFTPSPGGLLQGLRVILRVIFVLVWSNLLTCTTTPLAMTDSVETLLSPLRFIGVPVPLVAMILSVAIQFIPTLFRETEMIRRAQTARGARFDSRRLSDRAMAVLPLVVPIFLAAFKRADELSLAMEARGYQGKPHGKHSYCPKLTRYDLPGLLGCAVLLAAAIVIL